MVTMAPTLKPRWGLKELSTILKTLPRFLELIPLEEQPRRNPFLDGFSVFFVGKVGGTIAKRSRGEDLRSSLVLSFTRHGT